MTESGLSVHFSSRRNSWETPQALFDKLNEEFYFELDVCATLENAKCKKYYSPAEDGLKQEWKGVCWMNPPYGREIGKWLKKAYESALAGTTVVCLVPARTDTAWWFDYCVRGEIRFIKGRLKFGGSMNAAPFPSAIIVFSPLTLFKNVVKYISCMKC
ncbi:MAG: adenine methyltransferase [Caldithrix sp.]|nr:MAG: adenine methyltransferase [Caldithrix sp.]